MPISISNTTLTFNDATTMTTAATSPIPAGTVMLFYQNAAPTGWTIVTSQNNKALRVVSGSGGVSGGSVAFTTAFTSQSVTGSVGTTGATTLSTTQIPSHTHSYTASNNANVGNASSGGNYYDRGQFAANSGTFGANTGGTGSTGSHDHTGGTFTGTAINLAVQYIDIILCSKN
jgi:hypothetical protein